MDVYMCAEHSGSMTAEGGDWEPMSGPLVEQVRAFLFYFIFFFIFLFLFWMGD